MKKSKTVLMAGVGCMVLGGLLLVCGFLMGGRPGFVIDEQGIHSAASVHQKDAASAHVLEKTELDDLQNIEINLAYADLSIIPSDGYYLEYRLTGSRPAPAWGVSDNTLSFQEGEASGNPFHFSFFSLDSFQSTDEEPYYVNLYVPREALLDTLQISSDYGDASLEELSCQTASVSLDYGDLSISSLHCADSVSVLCSYGDMDLGTLETGTCDFRAEYGNLSCDAITGTDGILSLDSGNFRADRLSFDQLTLENSYGNIQIQEGSIGQGEISLASGDLTATLSDTENLSVKNEYGDVSLQLEAPLSSYSCDLVTEYGEISLPEQSVSDSSGSAVYTSQGTGSGQISISCESGDIQIR